MAERRRGGKYECHNETHSWRCNPRGTDRVGEVATAQSNWELHEPEVKASLEPLRPGITENQIFAELVAHNELRTAAPIEYSTIRTYQVKDLSGKVHAQETACAGNWANGVSRADKKTFVVTSENGSGLIRRVALNPLIASEIEAASGKKHSEKERGRRHERGTSGCISGKAR